MFSKKFYITRNDYERLEKIFDAMSSHEYNQSMEKLREKFKKAKLIDSKEIKPTVITMNSKFRLKNLGNGLKKEYVLVFPDDSDPLNNKISVFDKIGSEIFTHEVGDVIHFDNESDAYYIIENIIYQPEAAGDYYL